jgi:acetyl esterase/lipase
MKNELFSEQPAVLVGRKRNLIAGSAVCIFAAALSVSMLAAGQAPAASQVSDPVLCAESTASDAFLGISTIRLWPGDAPEAKGTGCGDIPTLTVLRTQPGRENGSAVLVLPGGGYMGLASILEGREVADWFTARGFTAFVLRYRLGSKYLLPVPLIDARRAVQLVRARAGDYKVDPHRIVIIGFSAGGHLAALSSTQFVPGDHAADDPISRVSSRPDYTVLGYPWIGGITPDTSHLTYCKLVDILKVPGECEALQKAYSPELYVSKETPPTFIYHTTEDETVPVEQALSYYEALLKSGVSAEMHIFARGGHGSGLGSGNAALDQWPNLLENWLRDQGLMAVSAGGASR